MISVAVAEVVAVTMMAVLMDPLSAAVAEMTIVQIVCAVDVAVVTIVTTDVVPLVVDADVTLLEVFGFVEPN